MHTIISKTALHWKITAALALALGLPLPSVNAAPAPRVLPKPVLAGKISPAPPPGVHPRILISPEDLPRLRRLYAETECGRAMARSLENNVNGFTGGEHKGQAAVWRALVAGDPAALEKTPDEWFRRKVSVFLELVCFHALLTENAERGKQAATALVTLAGIGQGEEDPSVALAYDFIYPYMNDEQRAAVRKALAAMTAGKQTYGLPFPPSFRDYNWMGAGMKLVLTALAIEGEEGYDPVIYPGSLEVMTSFLDYGIRPDGTPVEEMHY
jgi:hypothetical protein